MKTDGAAFSLGIQQGGPDSAEVTSQHLVEFRKLLSVHCRGPYSPEVDEFSLIFRVDGKLDRFGFEGAERLRRSRKNRYVTIDLGIPRERWEGVPIPQLREYIARCVDEAVRGFIARLEKDKTPVDSERLLADYQRARRAFLSGES